MKNRRVPCKHSKLDNEKTEAARESKVGTRQKPRAHTERANYCLSNYLNLGKMRWEHSMKRMRMITDNEPVFHLHQDLPGTL